MKVNGYEIKPEANLRGAYLYGADLRGANLRRTDLSRANLRRADLRRADLREADLSEAYLYGADLSETNLRETNLRGANLTGANLYGAYLYGADLSGAYLYGADLSETNLTGADLSRADLPDFQICPEEGSFIAWKGVHSGVIKLLVPATAKRTSSLIGRKCRAEYVYVLSGSGKSDRGGVYVEGTKYYPDSYDDDIRVECSHGVHFFMTKAEAERWSL